MKFKIVHECHGRIRIIADQRKAMSLHEADVLQAWISQLPGVSAATVHERTKCAIIKFDAGFRNDIVKALSEFSYETAESRLPACLHSSRELNRLFEEKLVCKILGKIARRVCLPAPIRMWYTIIKSVPFIWRAIKSLFSGHLRVELLDGISIFASMLRRDFNTAGSVMFLLDIGELLEEWTHKKSVEDLARSLSLNVDSVWKVVDGNEVCVGLNEIAAEDLISIHTGGMIPLDGVLVEGECMVNQASLTGESVPVAKRPGKLVYAGTVVEEGNCILRVTQQCGDTRYDKIVSMIEQSEKLKSAAENRASHLADKLVPYTLLTSAITFLFSRNVTRAVAVLMVDFSCALKLAMPLCVLSAMREVSDYHMTVKGGKYLEAIAQTDTIVFDKTGTLTHACPKVVDVVTFGGRDKDEMLKVAACLEEHFPHSMANAVVRAAAERELLHEEMHSDVEYVVAHGIASHIGSERALIGSAHFVFEDEHCVVPEGERDKFEALPPQYSHLYLCLGDELAAVICISDPLRSEASAVMKALRDLGISRTVMLTGDSERTAASIAAEVGVDIYHSEVLPEDKARFVDQERAAGHTVMMIGDGINDTPALSAANVGVAISDGAAIAREIADVTISAYSLYELVTLRQISVALMDRINANYHFVIGFNGTLIMLGALGMMPPATSAILHNISTLGISLRSMTNLLR